MDISIFEVLGPLMIGPSSSHTAGAAKLGKVAKLIAGGKFTHVSFGLHGSFAKTYKGHGTDIALVAGVLGLGEDDERLAQAFDIAKLEGLTYEFYEIELDNMHENSVKTTFTMQDGSKSEVIGSSIGGGQIVIKSINGFEVELTGGLNTIIIKQLDKKGIVSEISKILSEVDINIGNMKLSRKAKGDIACCIIETDSKIHREVVTKLEKINNVLSVQAINA